MIERFEAWRALETLDKTPNCEKGEMYARLYETPAKTMQGVLLKLKLAEALNELEGSYLATQALQDLERLLGSQ